MNTQKIIRKYKKNTKALSPVVASIILIAVTVAVSVVVAAWMSGSIFGLMGTTEQATITNLGFDYDDLGDTITVSIQNAGNAPVTITQVTLNTQVVTPQGGVMPVSIPAGELDDSIILGVTDGLSAGDQYTVKATTSAGNNIILTAFAPADPSA